MRRNNKNSLDISIGIALFSVLVTALPLVTSAQICEYPLPIQRNIPNGNVMFVMDSSNSMNTAVYHDDYDPLSTYAGPFDPADTYEVAKTGVYGPDDFDNTLPSTPTASLVESDNSGAGLYPGNYLNWIYYAATDAQRASLPQATRIQTAKAVLTDIAIEHYDRIRFGVYIFHDGGDGGTLNSKVGSPRSNFLNQVAGVQAKGPGATAETLMDVSDYFAQTGNLAPIEYECQKSFVVVLTDGYPTEDLNVSIGDWDGDGNEPGTCASIGSSDPNTMNCSDYMDDVAGYMFERDHRGDLDGLQNLVTYVVGYYIDAPLLRETAANGDGLFLSASNVNQLSAALTNVLRDIVQRISAGSAIAVVSTEDQTEDRLYRTKYLPVKWYGFVEAFALPYSSGDSPVWEAGSLLAARSPASRDIFTSVNGNAIEFTSANADQLYLHMGLATEAEAIKVIEWVRGTDVPGLRDRNGWPLGDVVDSSPVVIGKPSGFSFDPDYANFRITHENRESAVYFGANDAMMHALRAEDGFEWWAYIPYNQLSELASIADTSYCHLYSVNQTPRVKDLEINGTWKTVLVGAERQGGNTYFAIDISDPTSPQFMWETTIANLHGSWATPAFATVPWHNNPVMIVGTGPNDVNYTSAVVMLDMSDGSLIWSDLLAVHTDLNKATSATTVDLDLNGVTDLAYMSDLSGRVYRIDLATYPPTVTTLFQTSQPIQSPPVLTVDYNNDVFVYFGTGKYLEVPDFDDTTPQTFYCVYDDHTGVAFSRSDLVDQTDGISPITNNDHGWYVDLEESAGERMTEPPAIVAEVVYATSFEPAVELCGYGGFSWLYNFKFRNGAAHDDDDDVSNDSTDRRVEEIGEGIASKPVVDVVNEDVIVQGSDTEIHVRDAKGTIQLMIVRSWRQRYN
jgi:type IV pilus assembly protein PilY1